MSNCRIVFVLTFALIFAGSSGMYPSPQNGDASPSSETKGHKSSQKIYTLGYGVTAPVFVSKTQPSVADAAPRRIRHGGSVALAIVVEADGTVGDVKILGGGDKDLGDIAVNDVKTWKFKPATKAGKPVAVRVTVDIDFHKR